MERRRWTRCRGGGVFFGSSGWLGGRRRKVRGCDPHSHLDCCHPTLTVAMDARRRGGQWMPELDGARPEARGGKYSTEGPSHENGALPLLKISHLQTSYLHCAMRILEDNCHVVDTGGVDGRLCLSDGGPVAEAPWQRHPGLLAPSHLPPSSLCAPFPPASPLLRTRCLFLPCILARHGGSLSIWQQPGGRQRHPPPQREQRPPATFVGWRWRWG